jgi:hypothetical protein
VRNSLLAIVDSRLSSAASLMSCLLRDRDDRQAEVRGEIPVALIAPGTAMTAPVP